MQPEGGDSRIRRKEWDGPDGRWYARRKLDPGGIIPEVLRCLERREDHNLNDGPILTTRTNGRVKTVSGVSERLRGVQIEICRKFIRRTRS